MADTMSRMELLTARANFLWRELPIDENNRAILTSGFLTYVPEAKEVFGNRPLRIRSFTTPTFTAEEHHGIEISFLVTILFTDEDERGEVLSVCNGMVFVNNRGLPLNDSDCVPLLKDLRSKINITGCKCDNCQAVDKRYRSSLN